MSINCVIWATSGLTMPSKKISVIYLNEVINCEVKIGFAFFNRNSNYTSISGADEIKNGQLSNLLRRRQINERPPPERRRKKLGLWNENVPWFRQSWSSYGEKIVKNNVHNLIVSCILVKNIFLIVHPQTFWTARRLHINTNRVTKYGILSQHGTCAFISAHANKSAAKIKPSTIHSDRVSRDTVEGNGLKYS